MVLGKGWQFSIANGTKIRPLEMGRKSPEHFFKDDLTVWTCTQMLSIIQSYIIKLILTNEITAANNKIFTSKSSNCSKISSHNGLPEKE